LLLLATNSSPETSTKPLETTRLLLDAGADPNLSGGHCNFVLAAVFSEEYEVVDLLLERGADPNAICDVESLYDAVEFDYLFEQYDYELPDRPTPEDRASTDAWLAMLDRFAIRFGKRPPTELHALRRYGALRTGELEKRAKAS
jgi:hypothetical protein